MDQKQLLQEISQIEQDIKDKKYRLKELRAQLQGEKVQNYVFLTSNEEEISLLELFGEKNELFVVHNMGKSCAYCTMWADGFNSVYHHIIEKAAFAVSSPDSPANQDNFAASRGWRFPMVSTMNNHFKEDLGFKKGDYQYPGVSVFTKDIEGNIYHHTKTSFGPGDDFCIVWSLFDLLPSGYEDYRPQRSINKSSGFQLTNNIAVQVKDYDQAIQFYIQTLGLHLEKTFDHETKLSINGTNFYIENAPESSSIFFEFAVEDLAEAKNALLKEGCIMTKEYSEYSIMIEDPFGLKFHLFEVK